METGIKSVVSRVLAFIWIPRMEIACAYKKRIQAMAFEGQGKEGFFRAMVSRSEGMEMDRG